MDERTGAGVVRRVPWALAALVALAILVWSAVVLLGGTRHLPGLRPDCSVTRGEVTVDLDAAQAQRAATIAGRSVRVGRSLGATSAAVADALELQDREARVVSSALTGRTPHALTCRHGGAVDAEPDALDAAGLTERAAAVRRALDRSFGRLSVGGFAPGGVRSGHMAGSAHYEGRAVDVFFRPVNQRNLVRGWAVAQYLVAHADRLSIKTVIYDGRIWTARRSGEGWRDYSPDTSGRSRRVAAVLEHRDHVHVDVAD